MSTTLANVIEPKVFLSYSKEDSAEKTYFVQSGIAVTNAQLQAKANTGGRIVDLPFWKDLDPNEEPGISDTSTNLATATGTEADEQIARLLYLNKGWSAFDLSGEIAGDSPNKHIASRTDKYWERQWQRRVLDLSEGVRAENIANGSSDMIHDVAIEDGDNAAEANLIGRSNVVSAVFTLGDSFADTGIIAMHSVPYQRLVDNDDIDFIKDSDGSLDIPFYMGKRVIVDDSMTVVAGGTSGFKYVTMIYGAGAIGYGMGTASVPVEVDRTPQAGRGGGVEELWTRKTWLIHPFGYQFTSASVAGVSPTRAEYRDGANWSRVLERKNIPMAFLVTNG